MIAAFPRANCLRRDEVLRMPPDVAAAKAAGTEVVTKAGAMLLDFYGRTTSRQKGGPHDLVTEADTALETFILGELERRFPDFQVISEERTARGAESLKDFCWVLDPLDGTVNFAAHVPFFCISLALLHAGSPVLGWVYDPLHRELFHAQRGAGSFLNDKVLRLPPPHAPVIVGIDAVFIEWMAKTNAAARLAGIQARFGRTRTYGCAALSLCYVGAGRLRATLTSGCKIWDDAAGALIVEEAGGSYADWQAQSIFPLRAGSPILAGGPINSIAAERQTLEEICAIL